MEILRDPKKEVTLIKNKRCGKGRLETAGCNRQ